MTNFFKRYLWIFEWIGAALLITLGVVVAVEDQIVHVVTGIVLTLFGLFRVIPLVKTTKTKSMKIILTIEVVLNIIIGGLLIYFGLKENPDLKSVYGYLLGAILYARAVIYFLGTSIFKERTTPIIFILHIAFITLGTWFIVSGGFTSKQLGIAVLVIAVLVALMFILHGIRGYKSYRLDSLTIEETQGFSVKDEKKKEKKKNKHQDVIVDKQEEQREENILN